MLIILIMVFIKSLEIYKEKQEVLFNLVQVVYMVVVFLEYSFLALLKVIVLVLI